MTSTTTATAAEEHFELTARSSCVGPYRLEFRGCAFGVVEASQSDQNVQTAEVRQLQARNSPRL